MSVRKLYQLTVNGKSVFSGSYSCIMSAYTAVVNSFDCMVDSGSLDRSFVPVIAISFVPNISYRSDVEKGKR